MRRGSIFDVCILTFINEFDNDGSSEVVLCLLVKVVCLFLLEAKFFVFDGEIVGSDLGRVVWIGRRGNDVEDWFMQTRHLSHGIQIHTFSL